MTPYDEGYAAGRVELGESDNPYSDDRTAAIAWNGGWRDATKQDPNALEDE